MSRVQVIILISIIALVSVASIYLHSSSNDSMLVSISSRDSRNVDDVIQFQEKSSKNKYANEKQMTSKTESIELPSLQAVKRWRPKGTKPEAKLLLNTEWVRVEEHVRVQKDKKEFTWIWVDVPSQVNIIVHRASDNKFLFFNQTKYGLKGYSLAPVGGQIEAGETPEDAAIRELDEEMGLVAGKLIPLGTYRVDVNRGFGTISCFLALDSKPSKGAAVSDDIEDQNLIIMSWKQLFKAIRSVAFHEIKWAGVLAIAIINLLQNDNIPDDFDKDAFPQFFL